MQHRFLVLLAIFWAPAVWAGNNAGGAFTVWLDTGQSKCYNNTVEIPCPAEGQAFHGQDAQYQGPARSYTKLDGSGNPVPEDAASWVMVRDNVTGLVWEVKENGDGTKEYSNPHDADNTYTWCDTDPATNGGSEGNCGIHNTKGFINALNNASFGGHTDWRLPTLKELQTLVDYAGINPAIAATFFPDTRLDDEYWSATPCTNYTDRAFSVYFYSGVGDANNKSIGSLYVRAVRGGTGSAASYTDNGDGTVTDMATGLMWVQASADTDDDGSPDRTSWQEALAWCQNLELAGYTDWRLPNINELSSIVDYAKSAPVINTTFFPDTRSADYWSATTYAGYTSHVWRVDFNGYGGYSAYDKVYSYYVRCVRGQQFGSFVFDPISDQTAGSPFQIRITAQDQGGNIVSYYNGSVQITSDVGDVTPADVTLVNGQASVTVSITGTGDTRLYADDGIHPQGQSNVFTVSSFSWPMFLPAVTAGHP
ncbi:MAG: hypothetical protein CSA26_00225 [Desulfobacterales bacterium]|nr:MAG: hypothetical protein CSA26_00225 [Desulfobacterales bacterium]